MLTYLFIYVLLDGVSANGVEPPAEPNLKSITKKNSKGLLNVSFSNENITYEDTTDYSDIRNGHTIMETVNEGTTSTNGDRPSFMVGEDGDSMENVQEATEAVDEFPLKMENGMRYNNDLAEKRRRLR